jgi:hypothetical protein
MALIEVGSGIFRDTDDLEQAEYHYFRKAESFAGKVPNAKDTARRILLGNLTAEQIDTLPRYEWLRTPDEQARR